MLGTKPRQKLEGRYGRRYSAFYGVEGEGMVIHTQLVSLWKVIKILV
jgi:hypothetical protein